MFGGGFSVEVGGWRICAGEVGYLDISRQVLIRNIG